MGESIIMEVMVMSNPKVTVLMPVYNGEKYLREAMDSILNQTFVDFEFLIINDGSHDRSVEIIESYSDPRIRLIHNKNNLKLVATLNKGLELSNGEYVARMDCDDISVPERLEKQVEFMDKNQNVGILGTGFQLIDHSNQKINDPIIFPGSHGLLKWSLHFECLVAHPTVILRKTVVKSVGGYTSNVIQGRERYSGEDYDLWRRASEVTKLSNLTEKLLFLRKHDDNVTKAYLDEHLKNSAMISQMMISQSLNEDISLELVEKLRSQKGCDAKDAEQLAILVRKLYRVYVDGSKLTATERQHIRKDVATKLLTISVPFINSFHLWKFIVLSLFLKSFLVFEFSKIRIISLLNKKSIARINGL